MPEISAGILLFRRKPKLEFFLAHPGGPYWKNKDEGAWSIPKGLVEENEDKKSAALREFEEEIGFRPDGRFINLGSIQQKGGKTVYCWAVDSNLPKNMSITSNTFKIEWPPRSGNIREFPEIDKADFFNLQDALQKINISQREFINRLIQKI